MTARVLIAGGGTGGHLFPGLAVAEELRGRGAAVGFAGTRRGIEARVVPQLGYPLAFIDIAGLKGRGPRALLSALRWPKALLQTARLLLRERPDVVVGVGGYASGPVVMLASLLRIPTAILEQNSVPGVTNRILGRVVRQVYTTYPESADFFPKSRVRQLGNPIRRALLKAAPPAGRPLTVLILGGSQGAHAVNELVAGAVEQLAGQGRALPRLRHQTGQADAEAVRARYQALGLSPEQALVEPFIEDMAAAYAACDLVIGRAGATTLSEITALGLPSVLIPFPFATDDHQTRNARWLESQAAARVLVQAETTPAQLAAAITDLVDDEVARRRMAQASRQLGRPGAALAVAEAVLGLASPGGR